MKRYTLTDVGLKEVTIRFRVVNDRLQNWRRVCDTKTQHGQYEGGKTAGLRNLRLRDCGIVKIFFYQQTCTIREITAIPQFPDHAIPQFPTKLFEACDRASA